LSYSERFARSTASIKPALLHSAPLSTSVISPTTGQPRAAQNARPASS
jgi:hypothetical protein